MVLALCEMQSVSSKIWTRVAVSISYDDNHYTISFIDNVLSIWQFSYTCLWQESRHWQSKPENVNGE